MSGSANLAMMHAATLAQELDKNKVTPGVLGFLVFAALAVGVWFLMKSLNRHMGRINFEEAPPAGAPKVAGPAAKAVKKV
ncbi:membrane protein [Streptomyces yaizuensis]|uniref:Membrane protein n=2 Tax=Streptomyces yaizuensis TaxID=2989713 RepID=A0ABQ5NVS5_9ACTN|nr:membrane protein [Streptomyces sp. YSPA8]